MASETVPAGESTAREREMRRIVSGGERDGLTVRETAARARMAVGTLAWWRSEIRRRDALRGTRPARPVFIEVVVADACARESGGDVAGEQIAAGGRDDSAPAFEVELRGGRRLRVAAGYGLVRLVREIEGC